MPSLFYRAGLAGGLAAQLANAYTVVNAVSPFMYKAIDPIVFPGSYTESHLHSFIGSDAITANTKTSAELEKGCTNIANPNDLSTYWVPTLLYTTDDGSSYKHVPMSRFSAYYNLGETPAEIAIPQDVQMVAGNAVAKSWDESPADAKVSWFCEGDDAVAADDNGFPSKTCSTHLQTVIFFPQCVNPDTLETAYKSRTYGTYNWCPSGSKSMPQLRFSIRYDLRKALPDGWSGTAPVRLASGAAWTGHGDFINGWTTDAAENMVATTAEKQEFAAVNGKLGNNGDEPDCTPKDAEPDKGSNEDGYKPAAKRAVDAWGWVSGSRFFRK